MAGEMVLTMLTRQDGVVNVIVYFWPVHRKTGTLFCPYSALVRFMKLRLNYRSQFCGNKKSAAINNEAIINGEAISSVPVSFASIWKLIMMGWKSM